MASPVESGEAVTSIAVAVAAPSLALLFTAWPFGIAFIASCVALIYVVRMDLDIAVKNIIGSTLIGGAISQLTAIPVLAIIKQTRPELLNWAENAQMPMTAILAIIIGLLAQQLMPKILTRLGKAVDGDK